MENALKIMRQAEIIKTRMHSLGRELVDLRFENVTLYFKNDYDDDDDEPTKHENYSPNHSCIGCAWGEKMVDIDYDHSWRENTSCHCHPEYERRNVNAHFQVPTEEIINDDLFFDDYYCIIDHPAIVRERAKIAQEKEETKQKLEQKRLDKEREEAEEKAAIKAAQDEADRKEYERLQVKFKGE